MDERIVHFIDDQKVASVCCIDSEGRPYCFSCFYVFDKKKNLLYFKSSVNAHHTGLLIQNPDVAGAIQPDKLNPLAIKGIQFTGRILNAEDDLCSDATIVYHKRYPFALAMPGEVWTIQLQVIKMTDNTLRFGKKINWQLYETVR
jgi:uncharacterized protein